MEDNSEGEEQQLGQQVEQADRLPLLDKKEVVDKLGIERQIYSFKTKDGYPIQVLFHGREDLPGETFPEQDVFLLGVGPVVRKPGDRWKFINAIDPANMRARQGFANLPHERDILAKGKSIFLVETSLPENLIDLAIILGADNPNLTELRANIHERNFTPEVNEILDLVIAGNIVNAQNKIDTINTTHDGNALMLKALTGDQEAKAILHQKKSIIDNLDYEHQKHDQENLQSFREEEAQSKTEPLKMDELIACHLTSYYPIYDKKTGEWYLQTTFDATKGKIARTTVHFTLNHPVADHMYGSWSDRKVAVLAPLGSLVEKNGMMEILNTVDTFWDIPPGGKLKLPKDAIVLVPGHVSGDKEWEENSSNNLAPRGPGTNLRIISYHPQYNKEGQSNLKETILGVIRQEGYITHGGGSWAWDGDSFEATAQAAKLGAELGVRCEAHTFHSTTKFEEVIHGGFSRGAGYLTTVQETSEAIQEMSAFTEEQIKSKLQEYYSSISLSHEQEQFMGNYELAQKGWLNVEFLRANITASYFDNLSPTSRRVAHLVGIF